MYDHHILWLSVFSHVNSTQKDRFSRCKWYENNFCIKCFQQILAPGTCFKHNSRVQNNQFKLSRMTNDRHLIFSSLTGSFLQHCTSIEKLLLSISFDLSHYRIDLRKQALIGMTLLLSLQFVEQEEKVTCKLSQYL